MKTKLALFSIPILFLSACSTTYYSSIPYDDIYYNGQDQVIANNSNYNEMEVYEDEYDSEYTEEDSQEIYQEEYPEYFNDSDAYYNFLFSARLRRFHRPYYSFGYYNNYFTNMYWYESNPYAWGSSIYLNTGWMLPYEYAGWSGNFYRNYGWGFSGYGMGWPYYNHGWPDYGHYGFGFGGYTPYYGYGNGYYYNSLDRYSYYYRNNDRHRPTLGRTYNRPNRSQNSFGEMYEQRTMASRQDRSKINNQRGDQRNTKSFGNKSLSSGTPDTGRNRSNKMLSNGSASTGLKTNLPYSRLNNGEGSGQIQENQKRSFNKSLKSSDAKTINTRRLNQQSTTKSIQRYQKPIQKYSKPNTYNTPNTRTTTNKQINSRRSITSPNTRMSSQPSNGRPNVVRSLKRVMTSPARSNKLYTSPTKSSNRSVSTSARSSGQRSYSSPARSSNNRSFSSPSKSSSSSSRSVSSGSRSSGSSSSSSGSSSGSSRSSSGSRGKR
ncbi:MAG: hypothetical protein GY834_13815 [Bacteroidetes bacterium]|nr:hypothetical protein [Bacteroidota bacterium]